MPDPQAVQPPHYAIWPGIVIGFGLGVTASWSIFLAYELIKLVELVI